MTFDFSQHLHLDSAQNSFFKAKQWWRAIARNSGSLLGKWGDVTADMTRPSRERKSYAKFFPAASSMLFHSVVATEGHPNPLCFFSIHPSYSRFEDDGVGLKAPQVEALT